MDSGVWPLCNSLLLHPWEYIYVQLHVRTHTQGTPMLHNNNYCCTMGVCSVTVHNNACEHMQDKPLHVKWYAHTHIMCVCTWRSFILHMLTCLVMHCDNMTAVMLAYLRTDSSHSPTSANHQFPCKHFTPVHTHVRMW